MNICIYGAASDSIPDTYKDAAYEIGQEIARNGHTMVFGAGATGMMGACARGATSVNGNIIGVTPNFMDDFEAHYDACTELIYTEDMAARKAKMEELADVFIVLPGGVGTYDEFFQIVTLAELKRKKAPIILYDVNNYYSDIIKAIDKGMHLGFIRKTIGDYYHVCSSPDEISEFLKEYFLKKS